MSPGKKVGHAWEVGVCLHIEKVGRFPRKAAIPLLPSRQIRLLLTKEACDEESTKEAHYWFTELKTGLYLDLNVLSI
jgi:hypothetical protein